MDVTASERASQGLQRARSALMVARRNLRSVEDDLPPRDAGEVRQSVQEITAIDARLGFVMFRTWLGNEA